MKRLKNLSLRNHRLEYISDFFFSNFKHLQYLNLEGNLLANITSATFYGLKNLENLNLNENKLSSFDNCTFATFPNKTKFFLRGNPLRCDCAMRWLRVRLEAQTNLNKMICWNLPDRPEWSQLTRDQFCSAEAAAKLPACQMRYPPTKPVPITKPPPLYTLQVSVIEKVRKDGGVFVRIDINSSQDLTKIFSSWSVKYGRNGEQQRRQTEPPSALNAYVIIDSGLSRGQPMVFCPVLTFASKETYEHPSYCRKLTVVNSNTLSVAIVASGVAGGAVLLIVLLAVALYCALRSHQSYPSLNAKYSINNNQSVPDDDPYAYAEPEALTKGKTAKYSSPVNREAMGMRPRLQPNSRAFSRAKSHDANLNMAHTSMVFSRTPMHHRSTPHLLKGQLANGHANRGFATSMTSLNHNNIVSPPFVGGFQQQRHSSVGAGYPLSSVNAVRPQAPLGRREFNSSATLFNPRTAPPLQQRLMQKHMSQPRLELLGRSTDQLAMRSTSRALPPPPRMANSVGLILDPSCADNVEDQAYMLMGTHGRRRRLAKWQQQRFSGNELVRRRLLRPIANPTVSLPTSNNFQWLIAFTWPVCCFRERTDAAEKLHSNGKCAWKSWLHW